MGRPRPPSASCRESLIVGILASLLKRGRELTDQPRASATVQRYGVHFGLLGVAAAVLLVSRLAPALAGIDLGLPSQQPVALAIPSPTPEEPLPLPLQVPAVITDTYLHRVAIPHTFSPELPTHDLTQHVVERGDTPNGIAEEYGIDPATLLWSNPNLSDESQLLQVGITLTILPVNGVLHTVVASDTVESIAGMYDVDPQAITEYGDNHLEKWPHRPVPGTEIVVPGGEKPLEVWTFTANSRYGRVQASDWYGGPLVYAGLGRFIWPTWGAVTQIYWWGHRAIDIAGPIDRPVAASDSGTVVYTGWSPVGYGNLIVLDHGNGFQTYYAHLNSIWVATGQWVTQGANIGGMGTTGRSSGPHLHFEIRYGGALLNPYDYLP